MIWEGENLRGPAKKCEKSWKVEAKSEQKEKGWEREYQFDALGKKCAEAIKKMNLQRHGQLPRVVSRNPLLY